MITIAVDIGGTFTDVVGSDAESGACTVLKVPTRRGALVEGVREGVDRLLAQHGGDGGDVTRFVHGTTIGTNAVLERSGARTAVLATEGFEDVLEIGRLKRSRMYDLFMDAETPVFLSPKRRRRGIRERVAADGSVVDALDEQQARRAVRELVEHHGAEAFAVSLLFSFRNGAHERRVRELIAEIAPDAGVSLSCEVDPTFREYERTVVTAFDAYVRPVIESYVTDLERELLTLGVQAPLQIMQSRGGLTSARLVGAKPVSVLLSGPAAGVIGGTRAAAEAGEGDVITIDIGGTSADVSLVAGGRPLISTAGKIERYPLRVPMIDVTTIGAGGGSVATADDRGAFRVGPRSAGADPGPACYGRGGEDATVTDASLVLGYLNPTYFAGGTLPLDVEAAHRVIAALGERLGMPPAETASGIHRVVNAKMADAIRSVSTRRGHDPRAFTLLLLGGAGPLHGGRLAQELRIRRMLVPAAPGVLSALGLLTASIEHDHAETVAVRADTVDERQLEAAFARVDAHVEEMMRAEQVPADAARKTRFADMRYVGQSVTLEVELEPGAISGSVERFHRAYQRVYGHHRPTASVEIVNVRAVHSWSPRPLAPTVHEEPNGGSELRSRRAFFEEFGGYVDTPVHRRGALATGASLEGPAIIEQADTTTVVYPGDRAAIDDEGSLLVEVGASR